MTICIAGKNKIAIDALNIARRLETCDDIVVVYNKNEDGINGWQPSFKYYCEQIGIQEISIDQCKNIEDLLFLSVEYDQIIKPIEFKSSLLFNLHFSLLPSYKGMYTSVMPLLIGENNAGVTLHKIDAGIDTGDVVDQIEFELSPDTNARMLYDKFLEYGKTLVERNFEKLISNSFEAFPQPIKNSSYYSKNTIDFVNLEIDLNKTAWEIHNQIRAYAFRPYQLPIISGSSITHSQLGNIRSIGKPGRILQENENHIIITCIDYNLKLFKDRLEYILELAKAGELQEMKRLYFSGFDVLEKMVNGWDAFIVASYNEQYEICKWLLSIGADPNNTNWNGTSPLMYAMTAASESGNIKIMQLLISQGADPNHKDLSGKTIFEYALKNGSIKVVEFLKPYCA